MGAFRRLAYAAAARDAGFVSLAAVTLMVNVCGPEILTSPLAVPLSPLSLNVNTTRALPLVCELVRNVRFPVVGSMAGWTSNAKLPAVVTVLTRLNVRTCPTSSVA